MPMPGSSLGSGMASVDLGLGDMLASQREEETDEERKKRLLGQSTLGMNPPEFWADRRCRGRPWSSQCRPSLTSRKSPSSATPTNCARDVAGAAAGAAQCDFNGIVSRKTRSAPCCCRCSPTISMTRCRCCSPWCSRATAGSARRCSLGRAHRAQRQRDGGPDPARRPAGGQPGVFPEHARRWRRLPRAGRPAKLTVTRAGRTVRRGQALGGLPTIRLDPTMDAATLTPSG
jgi:hypothetical protein